MTPLTVTYLPLSPEEILPDADELLARLRQPRESAPTMLGETVQRLTDAASPAALLAVGERTDELASLLSLDGIPALDGTRIALLAVTLGHGVDRLLRTYARRGVSDAFFADAAASAMAEAAANAADARLRRLYPDVRFGRRFSPGYGRLPLSVQPALLSLLGAGQRLGIRLTESSLMLPTKSITAILGGTHEPFVAD